MKHSITLLLSSVSLISLAPLAAGANPKHEPAAEAPEHQVYHEPYRPQYHFSPRKGWIGDPSGLLVRDSVYHAFWWGAATSPDLVHWTEQSRFAIKNMPEGTAAFTGSCVVDTANTAGYGPGAFIAAFTSFDHDSKKQSQSIAFSHDEGATFNWYDLNPVIDTWSTEFRDPTVIWHEPSQKWVMAVAKALEKKIAFYGSDDLKHWTWLSDFGPAGDSMRSWECPDLFQLNVDGDPQNRKWVLLMSINWAEEQYFTGDFDGTRFIPDDTETRYVDEGLDYYASRTFQNYDTSSPEAPVYSLGWVATWDYAHHVPGTHGKGFWSVPRQLSLITTPQGLRLSQQPAEALKQLRGKPLRLSQGLKPGQTRIKGVEPMNNMYEMDVMLTPSASDKTGLLLCATPSHRLDLSYDAATGTLLMDRTGVCPEQVQGGYERVAHTKVPLDKDGKLHLRVFVDRTSVEVFTADGLHVMTAQTYPAHEGQSDAVVYSLNGGTKADITVWPMASIWD